MKLPKMIYVTWQVPKLDGPFLFAEENLFDTADPDGEETVVGVYILTETKKVKRVVEEIIR